MVDIEREAGRGKVRGGECGGEKIPQGGDAGLFRGQNPGGSKVKSGFQSPGSRRGFLSLCGSAFTDIHPPYFLDL